MLGSGEARSTIINVLSRELETVITLDGLGFFGATSLTFKIIKVTTVVVMGLHPRALVLRFLDQ